MCSAVLCFLIPSDHAANTSVRVFLGALRSFVFQCFHAMLRCARISWEVFNKSGMVFPCAIAFTVLCASHARWRCEIQLLQPLFCENTHYLSMVSPSPGLLSRVALAYCSFTCSAVFCFFFGQCMLRTSWCTYLAGSVKHIRNGFPSKT